MERYLAKELKRIQLSHSEPLIHLNQLRRKAERVNDYEKKNALRQACIDSSTLLSGTVSLHSEMKKPMPPKHSNPRLTVVSPQKRIKQPKKSSLEGIPDAKLPFGQKRSSTILVQEKPSDVSNVADRLPADGCSTDQDEESSSSSEEESDNFREGSVDQDMMQQWLSASVEEEDVDYLDDGDSTMNDEEDNEDLDEEVTEMSITENESLFNSIGTLSNEKSIESGSSSYHRLASAEEIVKAQSVGSGIKLTSLTKLPLNEPPLPLLPSLFDNKPPTLYFTVEGEEVSQFPLDIRKILKWKSSTVTPKVVRYCLARTGFKVTKKNSEWLGIWGKHMKSDAFRSIKEHQKVNHFPGTFHIGRKDKLWRNFCRMRILHGRREFNFVPQTFILPHDISNLRKTWESSGSKMKWIVKPPASARGIGIKVIHKWSQLPKKRPVIVQRYLSKPFLINGSKFDLRIYVYVPSYDPLRIFIFEDGLVRFATSKYSSSTKSLSNKYMHLTNYSINKKNTGAYTSNTKDGDAQSHKWSLKQFWIYLDKKGIDHHKIWHLIKDIVVKTIICGESAVNSMVKQNCKGRYSCHELFGFDIILDSHLKPWLLEVNISPSLHSNSELDVQVKGQVVKDVLNMAGFFIPSSVLYQATGKMMAKVDGVGADGFWFEQPTLTLDERSKHTFYTQKHQDPRLRTGMLDVLTPNDIRILMEVEDELSRSGGFTRIFPTSFSKSYMDFFEVPRYYNLLVDEWTKRYLRDALRPSLGICLLQSYAKKAIHLGNQTDKSFIWSSSRSTLYSALRPISVISPTESSSTKSSMTPTLPNIRKKKQESGYCIEKVTKSDAIIKKCGKQSSDRNKIQCSCGNLLKVDSLTDKVPSKKDHLQVTVKKDAALTKSTWVPPREANKLHLQSKKEMKTSCTKF